MNALDRFHREAAEVLQFDAEGSMRTVKAVGWRYREFFLRSEGDEFKPFHLPSGLGMPFYFAHVEAAASFVLDLDRLRNDWVHLTADDWRRLRDTILALARERGADIAGFRRADVSLFMPRRNGYGGAA